MIDLVKNNDREWFWSHEASTRKEGLIDLETLSSGRERLQEV